MPAHEHEGAEGGQGGQRGKATSRFDETSCFNFEYAPFFPRHKSNDFYGSTPIMPYSIFIFLRKTGHVTGYVEKHHNLSMATCCFAINQ